MKGSPELQPYRPDECREGVTHEGYHATLYVSGDFMARRGCGYSGVEGTGQVLAALRFDCRRGPVLKGSVRGIPGLNVHQACQSAGTPPQLGGHAAAGFSVHSENVRRSQTSSKVL